MTRRQKKLLNNFIIVAITTIGFVVFMANVRSTINRSEAIRALELLGGEILQYRQRYGSLPSESYLKRVRKKLGVVRLGNIHYRAQWIDFGADANSTIMAYKTEPLKKFFRNYYLVLWLDGRVEQHRKIEFEKIRDKQQNEVETKWLREDLLQKKYQMPPGPDIF